jgi:hypothetical protein
MTTKAALKIIAPPPGYSVGNATFFSVYGSGNGTGKIVGTATQGGKLIAGTGHHLAVADKWQVNYTPIADGPITFLQQDSNGHTSLAGTLNVIPRVHIKRRPRKSAPTNSVHKRVKIRPAVSSITFTSGGGASYPFSAYGACSGSTVASGVLTKGSATATGDVALDGSNGGNWQINFNSGPPIGANVKFTVTLDDGTQASELIAIGFTQWKRRPSQRKRKSTRTRRQRA